MSSSSSDIPAFSDIALLQGYMTEMNKPPRTMPVRGGFLRAERLLEQPAQLVSEGGGLRI